MRDATDGGRIHGRTEPGLEVIDTPMFRQAPARDSNGNSPASPRAARFGPLLLTLGFLTACSQEPAATLSFNESIQPILSANCYSCHGPDSSSRKAQLRLDRQETAFKAHGKYSAAIVPGQPDESPLVERIEAKDPRERMPPPEAHKTLKAEEIALLRQWVKEGAHYEPHWSFIAPKRPVVPPDIAVAGHPWAQNEIDRFVLDKLAAEKLVPSEEADKISLIRRVTYDLTGLPPTPQEVSAFIADTAPNAYENVVDRLLASPRYGEHRAHYWLDYVRYADTNGLHRDNYRSVWPYRDYVIGAFNSNMPFDRFVREQLAGDLLPEQSTDTLVATGYIRSNPTTNEGGVIPEEVQFNLARDRVETFGVTFLGLTTGCAVCHDHKFDPTTQKDFYQLAAFMNNTAEAEVDFNTSDSPPVLHLPDEKDRASFDDLLMQRANLQTRLQARHREAPELMRARLSAGQRPQAVADTALELRLRFDEGTGNIVQNSAPAAAPAQFEAEGGSLVWGEKDWLWPSARFDSSTRLSLGSTGNVEADEPFSFGGWVMLRPNSLGGMNGPLLSRRGDPKGSDRTGWDLYYEEATLPNGIDSGYPSGRLFFDLVSDPATQPKPVPKVDGLQLPAHHPPPFNPMRRAIQVGTRQEVTPGEWMHLFVTYDGSRKANGVHVYLNGKPMDTEVMNDSVGAEDSVRTHASTQLGRFDYDGAVLRESRYQDIRFYRRALSADEVRRLPYEDPAAEIVARQSDPLRWTKGESFVVLDRYFLGEQDAQARRMSDDITALQAKMDALAPPPDRRRVLLKDGLFAIADKRPGAEALQRLIGLEPRSSLIAQERPVPAFAYVLKRGNYAARQERVEADTPHFLPPLPAGVPHDRLALANWLATPEQPLFARVAVNRMWQEIFGAGLVESSGDFGVMGDRPSHPKLLDWLAVEFRESGWDVKHMYKRMVMSATYRQSARVTPELLAKDPANRLLARGPRFRMDAEMLRDSALAVSGLLVDKIGGPPVKPYQPGGLWQEVAMVASNTRDYAPDHGEDLYRRSVYSFWKRTSPPPAMETFDATTRETACPRRARGDTPLQALVTLNDTQFIEAARMLAQRAMLAVSDAKGRIDELASLTLNRALTEQERAILDRSYQSFAQRFRTQPAAARALIAEGETRSNPKLDAGELAAWTMIASQFMNLDEFLTE